MKVKLESNYKRYYTVEEYEQAKVVIAAEKDDESKASEWAEQAVREFGRVYGIYDSDILTAEAYTAKNRRHYDVYTDSDGNTSGWMDVCIETYATVFVDGVDGIEIAVLHLFAMLSDIWQSDSKTDIAQYMSGTLYTKSEDVLAKH